MGESQTGATGPDVTEEEKQQEEELLKETPATEVRKSVIESFGLKEDDDKELIDKLVDDRTSRRKELSTAIKQKRTWREKAQTERKPEEKPETSTGPTGPAQTKKEDISKIVKETVNEELEGKELDAIDISDEAKTEIKAYAKVKGFRIKQVLESDFFKFIKERSDAAKKVEEAAIGGKHGAPTRQDFDVNKPPKPDMSTKEGRKEWADWKKFLKEQ